MHETLSISVSLFNWPILFMEIIKSEKKDNNTLHQYNIFCIPISRDARHSGEGDVGLMYHKINGKKST